MFKRIFLNSHSTQVSDTGSMVLWCWFCHEVAHIMVILMCLKDTDRMANSVDPDQTAHSVLLCRAA